MSLIGAYQPVAPFSNEEALAWDIANVLISSGAPTLSSVPAPGASNFEWLLYNILLNIGGGGPGTQVQSNWAETNPLLVSFIQNKPTIPAAQIQSDWDETDSGLLSFILNKPEIPVLLVDTDYATLMSDLSGGTLIPGQFYNCVDRGDLGIIFYATNRNSLSSFGTRVMLCPATYQVTTDGSGNNWIGVWDATKSASVDDLTVWGGLVYKNTTGNIGSSLDQLTLDPTDWDLIPKDSFSNDEYVIKVFNVQYDFVNDWIALQSDQNGNIFGVNYDYWQSEYGLPYNPCDISDWNFVTFSPYFFNNRCHFISNNYLDGGCFNNTVNGGIYANFAAGIYGNICGEGIYENVLLSNSDAIYFNNILGGINKNQTSFINYNSIQGSIIQNQNLGEISYNSNTGDITRNRNKGAINLNKNNGIIARNTSTLIVSILNNVNNGDIGTLASDTVRATDVTDPIVNK